jgi:hypothetical protein
MAAKSKRPTFASASKKLPDAGRAGVARAKDDHRRAEAKDSRSKATFDLPPDLMAELRTASTLAGETLAAIAERGLSAELQRLRDEIMGGKPFPMPVKTRKGRSPKG